MTFIAKTWNNGHHHVSGAGYGLKISFEDRETYFNPKWQTVILHLAGYQKPVEVNVAKPSFWNRSCGELIKNDIGIWLRTNDRHVWPKGNPYSVKMKLIRDREFSVELIN